MAESVKEHYDKHLAHFYGRMTGNIEEKALEFAQLFRASRYGNTCRNETVEQSN